LKKAGITAIIRYDDPSQNPNSWKQILILSSVNAGAKNGPPKGKGGPRLGSVDKDWVPS
jgi:hypothetical protein